MEASIPKFCCCPKHQKSGTLLVDLKTETRPCIDTQHHLLYYCFEGKHIFSGLTVQKGKFTKVLL